MRWVCRVPTPAGQGLRHTARAQHLRQRLPRHNIRALHPRRHTLRRRHHQSTTMRTIPRTARWRGIITITARARNWPEAPPTSSTKKNSLGCRQATTRTPPHLRPPVPHRLHVSHIQWERPEAGRLTARDQPPLAKLLLRGRGREGGLQPPFLRRTGGLFRPWRYSPGLP
jgi:hypothetical protein